MKLTYILLAATLLVSGCSGGVERPLEELFEATGAAYDNHIGCKDSEYHVYPVPPILNKDACIDKDVWNAARYVQ